MSFSVYIHLILICCLVLIILSSYVLPPKALFHKSHWQCLYLLGKQNTLLIIDVRSCLMARLIRRRAHPSITCNHCFFWFITMLHVFVDTLQKTVNVNQWLTNEGNKSPKQDRGLHGCEPYPTAPSMSWKKYWLILKLESFLKEICFN